MELSLEYKSMRQAIIDIEILINGFDIDLMDPVLRDTLRVMPLKSLGDIELWKKSWERAIGKLKRD